VKDYYRILGLPFGASVDQVRSRYRELARLYHPDVNADPTAEEKMRQINEAYHVLSSPERRLRYHLLLLAHQERKRRARQKALQKLWMAYQAQSHLPSSPPSLYLYLRYILLGILITIGAATAIYHFHHPFVVHKAHLMGYQWATWPPFLELPASITELFLQDNRFSEVPSVVWSLPHLQVLRLDRNGLRTLSSKITTLRELEVLSLRGNELTTLPRGWGELRRLREVDLRDNRLRQVPEELLDLPSLTRLDLRGNPLSAEMRWVLAQRRNPAILWDEAMVELDHTQNLPKGDTAKAVLWPASFPAMPHAAE